MPMEKIDRSGLLQFFQRVIFFISLFTLCALLLRLGFEKAVPVKDWLLLLTAPLIFCGIQIYLIGKVGFRVSFTFLSEIINSPHGKHGGGRK
jgi:hypothetical protein